jgi:hypothetical protein
MRAAEGCPPDRSRPSREIGASAGKSGEARRNSGALVFETAQAGYSLQRIFRGELIVAEKAQGPVRNGPAPGLIREWFSLFLEADG